MSKIIFNSNDVQTPWGMFSNAPMATVAEAMEVGGLNYKVAKAPNSHVFPCGHSIISETSFHIYKCGSYQILNDHVGKRYTPVQNVDGFQIVEQLIKEGMKITTAGCLDNGGIAFICLEYPDEMVIQDGDNVKQYATVGCSHNGGGVFALFSPIRVICKNTLYAAVANATSKIVIRHTSTAHARIEEAGKIMKSLAANMVALKTGFQQMTQNHIKSDKLLSYMGHVLLTDDQVRQLAKGANPDDVMGTRGKNILIGVMSVYQSGIGQSMCAENSAWKALNGVTFYNSHLRDHTTGGEKMNSLLFGTLAKQGEKAIALAMEPEKIQKLPTLTESFLYN